MMNNVKPPFSFVAAPAASFSSRHSASAPLQSRSKQPNPSAPSLRTRRVQTTIASIPLPVKVLSCAAAAIIASSSLSPPSARAGPLNSAPLRFSQSMMMDDENAPVRLQAHWDLHSIDSKTETFLMFSNDSDSVVDLWWVDYYGREIYYASIRPGTTHMQPSYVTHPWVVRDHLSQKSILMMVASPQPAMAIVNSVL